MPRVLVVGGVAAGMSAASQVRRRKPDWEVVVLERGPHVSYGACGLPYNIADPRRSVEDLVVLTAEEARRTRGITVRAGHEVTALETASRTLRVRDLADCRDHELTYDALVLATGASPVRPEIPGLDLPGVFFLRDLRDGAAVKAHLAAARPGRAVVVGGGYVGLEMAEAFAARGLSVTVLEKLDQLAPGHAPEIARLVRAELAAKGVTVHTGASVLAVEGRSFADDARDGDRLRVQADVGVFPAGLVLVSVGVRPNVALARAAGLAIGETGAVAVDASMRTSAPAVFAAGDCAEALHLVTGRPAWIPLGTTANKQGKVAGANAAGGSESFGGIVGTAVFRVFELEVGRTGLCPAGARRAGLDAVAVASTHRSRGHAFPGGSEVTTVLVVERGTGRLLGAQVAGREGVKGRVDVLATALLARMTLEQVEGLDLAYAPPLAPVHDPILIAASVARKALSRG